MTDFEVTVTIENLAPTGGTFLTPVWVGFHNGDFNLYDRGSAATAGLERLAEDGDTASLSQEFNDSGNGAIDGVVVVDPDNTTQPIAPETKISKTFTIDRNSDNSAFFSYASMILPSNDAFIANDDPLINPLFDEQGKFLGADLIVAGSQVLDAGTEVNDELVENTRFFGQQSPDTGDEQNGVVDLHPGFDLEGRILSEDGTTQNESADFDFNNADFTQEGYQVARITVSLVDEAVNIVANLDGAQQVAVGDTEASGTSILTLNDTGNSLRYSLTVTGLDFGANGWIEGGAQTPDDTSDDVTRLNIKNAPAGENGDVVFSLLDSTASELGNVSDIQGNQDDDLKVTLNADGSVTLTGSWDGTDPASTNIREFVSDIREGEAGEDLDLYWDVDTEGFSAGAIRGQLAIEDDAPLLDTEFFRFQNSAVSGTYLYAAGDEAQRIRDDFKVFDEEGVGFKAAIEPDDDLVAYTRLQSLVEPGTYLYVEEQELRTIQADPNLINNFTLEGVAFHVYGAGSGLGEQFIRFRNLQRPSTYLYATGQEVQNIRDNFSEVFEEEGIAFEAVI